MIELFEEKLFQGQKRREFDKNESIIHFRVFVK